MRIVYTSKLTSEHLPALQDLMFFNRNQQRFRSGIVSSVEHFGEPIIKGDSGFLRVHTSRLGEVQALFALEEEDERARPIAAMVYAISASDTITLLHMAVDADFASDGPQADRLVIPNLFGRLIEACRQLRSIEKIVVLYGAKGEFEIAVRRRSPGDRAQRGGRGSE